MNCSECGTGQDRTCARCGGRWASPMFFNPPFSGVSILVRPELLRSTRQVFETASLLQQALLLLETVDWVLANDLQNYSAREIKEHPGLRTKLGFRLRIEKLTRQA